MEGHNSKDELIYNIRNKARAQEDYINRKIDQIRKTNNIINNISMIVVCVSALFFIYSVYQSFIR